MRTILSSIARGGARAAIAVAFAIGSSGSAWAVSSISSNATDLKVALTVAGIKAGVTTGTASGTAGPAYNDSNQVLGVGQTLALGGALGGLLGQGLSTGVMTASAQSNFPASNTGSANATISDLGLGLAVDLGFLGSLNVLSLGSSAVTSTTTFDGSNFIGVSSLADLSLNSLLFSLPIDASAYVGTAANRTLLDILGLKIVLNEQIATDQTIAGIETRSLTTNALHLVYDNFVLGGNLLSGDIVVGQSQVSVTQAVPEPATWAMMILGFGGIGYTLRRQQKLARAIA